MTPICWLLAVAAGVYLAGAFATGCYLSHLCGGYAGTFAGRILRESLLWPLTLLERWANARYDRRRFEAYMKDAAPRRKD